MDFKLDYTDQASIKNSFDRIAGDIFTYLTFVAGENEFHFTEIEFYHYHPEFHPDPFVHRHPQQQKFLNWYFHGSGLDVCIRNESETGTYSSFLIRGIKGLKDGGFTNGPINVVTRIFEAFGNSADKNSWLFIVENTQPCRIINGPFSSERIGLSGSGDTSGEFLFKKYRFIIDVVPDHKFENKEKLIKELLNEGKIKLQEVKAMLGYNFKDP
ncbi:MAG TPA: hypothetical protein VI583_14820 [Cyclobacteriaceae bacterium]|nr:hypothetical protein [Cyclobacteriaceae bacterium]